MKRLTILFLFIVIFCLSQSTVSFGQEAVAKSPSVLSDFNNPIVYLLFLTVLLTLFAIYKGIKANMKLTELGYVDNGSPNSFLRWTANNPTKVAVILILVVLTGIILAV